MILYGIPSCDTCRKAKRALEAAGYAVTLHDVRAEPLAAADWTRLLATFGGDLVNHRSTTWRALSDLDRVRDPGDLLAEYPTLMRRPVVAEGDRLTLGWTASVQAVWGV